MLFQSFFVSRCGCSLSGVQAFVCRQRFAAMRAPEELFDEEEKPNVREEVCPSGTRPVSTPGTRCTGRRRSGGGPAAAPSSSACGGTTTAELSEGDPLLRVHSLTIALGECDDDRETEGAGGAALAFQRAEERLGHEDPARERAREHERVNNLRSAPEGLPEVLRRPGAA